MGNNISLFPVSEQQAIQEIKERCDQIFDQYSDINKVTLSESNLAFPPRLHMCNGVSNTNKTFAMYFTCTTFDKNGKYQDCNFEGMELIRKKE